MPQHGKHFNDGPGSKSSNKVGARECEPNQLDFELEFFGNILARSPDYVDVLRVMASLLSLKGLFAEGLKVDRKLVRLRPADPLAHYNLACSYALLKRADASLKMLRRAVELGYRDFRYMREDHDLDAIKQDPRFRQLLREFETI
ncbi:MAG: TPR end-of-group domain-containing protein [Gemmataceae bacterium]